MGTSSNYSNEFEMGIIPRTIKEIFNQIEKEKEKKEFIIKVTFLEIYNEDIHDLLEFNK